MPDPETIRCPSCDDPRVLIRKDGTLAKHDKLIGGMRIPRVCVAWGQKAGSRDVRAGAGS